MLIIEGVVGVGKSSLMNYLVEEGFTPFPEPVVNNPILDRFYYDRKRYAFPLQVFFLAKRFEHLTAAAQVEDAVMDRSIYGDGIFAAMHKETKTMEAEEYGVYEQLYKVMIDEVKKPDLLVYLQVSVDVAMKRIQKRGRDFEQSVERSYWEKLNQKYEEYFSTYDQSPILIINVDHLDFESSVDDRLYILMRIKETLEKLKHKNPN
ncbi:MAG: deoxynucleoside kinase [Erysipelotrichaceae bacterium]|nr:deoxynucleoside kinase [Erysipelotrichaceae bacterium]